MKLNPKHQTNNKKEALMRIQKNNFVVIFTYLSHIIPTTGTELPGQDKRGRGNRNIQNLLGILVRLV